MNLFKSLKNRKGAIGAISVISIGLIILILAFAIASASYVKPVLAAHTATITINPNVANCNELGDTFTVHVTNNGPDSLLQVEIYKALEGISDFVCGPAPTGWTLFSYEDRCIYVTGLNSAYKIAAGNSLDFTFDAVMSKSSCKSTFTVVTVDDHRPAGDRKTYDLDVLIDCTDPLLYKNVGTPKVLGTGFDWWVTSNTPLNMFATDNTSTDVCNLGIDYCRYRLTVDGGTPTEWTIVKDGAELNWVIYLAKDSNHLLDVECYDKAGNKVTLTENDKVDNTPPVTTKTFNGPKKIDGDVEWIDGVTTVTLNPTDPDPTGHQCNISVEKTWYLNTLAEGEKPCLDPTTYCTPICDNPYSNPDNAACIEDVQKHCYEDWNTDPQGFDSWESCVEYHVYNKCEINCNGLQWKLYRGVPIPKDEESCHVLQFFSVDALGNVEDVNTNCFFVDKTPPALDKSIGQPNVDATNEEKVGNGKVNWVTSQYHSGTSSVQLSVLDGTKDWAGIDILVDIPLNQINSLTFWELIKSYVPSGWDVNVILGVDSNNNGVFDSNIAAWHVPQPGHSPAALGGDTFIEMDGALGANPSTGVWSQIDAYNTPQWWTVNAAGNGFGGNNDPNCYNTLPLLVANCNQDVRFKPTDHVKLIKLEIGGSGSWNNEKALVDGVTLNGNVILDDITTDRFTWVSPQTSITFSCQDQLPHPSGDEQICFKVSYDQEPFDLTIAYCSEYSGTVGQDGFCCKPVNVDKNFVFNFNQKEDSAHDLEYYCKDAVEKKSETQIQYYKVDSAAPTIAKTIIGPSVGTCPPNSPSDTCYIKDWSNGDGTTIHVEATDPDPTGKGCNVDQVKCEYYYLLDDGKDKMGFVDDSAPPFDIKFNEDSKHELHIKCWDALKNKAIEDIETFYVDSTPPTTTKTFGDPFRSYDGNVTEYITSSTPITLTAEDTGPHKSGIDKTLYLNVLADSDKPCLDPKTYCQPAYLSPPTDCVLNVEGFCDINWEGKGYDSWKACVEDLIYNKCFNGEGDLHWQVYTGPFQKEEESCHILEYYSIDSLGNTENVNVNCFSVDNTPPKVDKVVGQPQKVIGDKTYITSTTPITLTCNDQQPHPVDHSMIWYRYRFANTCDQLDSAVWGQWIDTPAVGDPAVKIITFPQDSCHQLEYYCEDALGNRVGENYLEVGINNIDSFEKIGGRGDITQTDSTIFIDDESGEGGDVYTAKLCDGVDCIEFKACIDGSDYVSVKDGKLTMLHNSYDPMGSPFDCPKEYWNTIKINGVSHPIFMNGDNTYMIEDQPFSEIDVVDTQPPVITKTLVGPSVGDCPGTTGNGDCYIKDWSNGAGTTIHVTAIDPDPHPVDSVKCEWFYTVDGGGKIKGSDDTTPPFDIKFYEDSVHVIDIKCWDALKNKVEDNTETFYVDSTPPTTRKDYGLPFYTNGTNDWINSSTPITLSATDGGAICKVGLGVTKYRYCLDTGCYKPLDGKETIGQIETTCTCPEETPWITYDETPFKISPDSEHCIQFYSEDALGNTEEIKSQCVYVDNQPPTVDKTISDPKELWAGENTFYPGLTDRCWSTDPAKMIECWKITLGNTLSLGCTDSDPHPVDQNTMCFQVELDGEDKTSDYCRFYQGQFNYTGDSYCCVEGGIQNFKFTEESQHDLKVKCVDALGNAGKVDEEKFKVEGCTDNICLNKKWNLISVPFVLFNDDPSEVFKNISDSIVSVWSYDNKVWYTWTPGVGGTLTSIKPGYGYWVLSKEDNVCFDVGGSLLSPETVPPSRDLQPGWNLIGYYGNTQVNKDGLFIVDGLNSNKCKIADKPVYCALNSLIDTQQGFPRWSSLWNYFNYGNDKAGWEGLSACIDGKWTAEMKPDKGYWIEMDVSDGYAPATNCIWNTDLKCVNQFA